MHYPKEVKESDIQKQIIDVLKLKGYVVFKHRGEWKVQRTISLFEIYVSIIQFA